MAIYSKKGRDPTEAALSAIQNALNVRETDAKAPPANPLSPSDEATEGRRRGPRSVAREMPFEAPAPMPSREERDTVEAANDDRASIGQVLQALQRQPS